jgi:hypothetical protein
MNSLAARFQADPGKILPRNRSGVECHDDLMKLVAILILPDLFPPPPLQAAHGLLSRHADTARRLSLARFRCYFPAAI